MTRTCNNANPLNTGVGGGITRTCPYDEIVYNLDSASNDGSSVIQGYDSLNRRVRRSDEVMTATLRYDYVLAKGSLNYASEAHSRTYINHSHPNNYSLTDPVSGYTNYYTLDGLQMEVLIVDV